MIYYMKESMGSHTVIMCYVIQIKSCPSNNCKSAALLTFDEGPDTLIVHNKQLHEEQSSRQRLALSHSGTSVWPIPSKPRHLHLQSETVKDLAL